MVQETTTLRPHAVEGQFSDAEDEEIVVPPAPIAAPVSATKKGRKPRGRNARTVAAPELFDFTSSRGNALSADQYWRQEAESEGEEGEAYFTPEVARQLRSAHDRTHFSPAVGAAAVTARACQERYLDDNGGMLGVQDKYDQGLKKDPASRQTVQIVFDGVTKATIRKLTETGVIEELADCISTGKEACVFFARSARGAAAVKVYKTATSKFENRTQYIEGNFKYSRGVKKKGMVDVWASKEHSNLLRLARGGVPVPEVRCYRPHTHVLVMEFIGEADGTPAPLLKNVTLDKRSAGKMYWELVEHVWTMYNVCNLVHADLSEFNILCHRNKPIIIDVSQSVSEEHVKALKFLREDCFNVTRFFRKKGVPTMTLKEFIVFIVDKNITTENKDEWLDVLKKRVSERGADFMTEDMKIDEEVFKNTYLPQNFAQVVNFERDRRRLKEGSVAGLEYPVVLGMVGDLSGAVRGVNSDGAGEERTADGGEGGSTRVCFDESPVQCVDAEEEQEEGATEEVAELAERIQESVSVGVEKRVKSHPDRAKNETKDERTERKKAVKAQVRENRILNKEKREEKKKKENAKKKASRK